jgi:hypothetical protein
MHPSKANPSVFSSLDTGHVDIELTPEQLTSFSEWDLEGGVVLDLKRGITTSVHGRVTSPQIDVSDEMEG